MDYIFTETIFETVQFYININNYVLFIFNNIYLILLATLPFIVKSLIGYCHFYYQLGYGLVFYIYLFRRYKSKKKKNWRSFYGNSIANWILFNIAIFNKFILNKNLIIFLKNNLTSTAVIIHFLINQFYILKSPLKQINSLYIYITKNWIKSAWTPIFKRSSYISALTFLKRFSKRK